MQKNFFQFFLLLVCLLLLLICVVADAESSSMSEGTGALEDEILIPWKKLYRPRGPPRFGKRALVLMDDESLPLEWKKRFE